MARDVKSKRLFYAALYFLGHVSIVDCNHQLQFLANWRVAPIDGCRKPQQHVLTSLTGSRTLACGAYLCYGLYISSSKCCSSIHSYKGWAYRESVSFASSGVFAVLPSSLSPTGFARLRTRDHHHDHPTR